MDDDRTAPRRRAAADDSGVHRQLARLTASLEASPAELVGLAALLLGGVACLGVLVWWAQPAAVPAATGARGTPVAAPAERVTVHVVGAVTRPGIVELPASARVVDAVAAAGGATVLADLARLNLARSVTDGERIEVPPLGAPTGSTVGADGSAATGAFDAQGRLDINRATVAELETLPGIGPVLAQRIIDHREANGPFASTGALRGVPGIGERSFQQLAELVVVP